MTTDTQTKPKAIPAWMKRDPLTAAETAVRLALIARGADDAARMTADRDVADGLRERSATLYRAANLVTVAQSTATAVATDLLDRLDGYADARKACAIGTTGDRQLRAAYMDDAHTFREALRHLGAGK